MVIPERERKRREREREKEIGERRERDTRKGEQLHVLIYGY